MSISIRIFRKRASSSWHRSNNKIEDSYLGIGITIKFHRG